MSLWKEGETPLTTPGKPVSVEPAAVKTAWANLKASMERDGWQFRDIVVRENARKFGGCVTDAYPLGRMLHDMLLGPYGFAVQFLLTEPRGVILVREEPNVTQPDGYGSYVRARFGWAAS
jgi:hypothetical protein